MTQRNIDLSIACGADENFAIPMAVMLYSAVKNLNTSRGINVFIVDGGFHSSTRLRVEKVVRKGHPTAKIHWLTPAAQRDGAVLPSVLDWISNATYLRLHLPEIIPDSVDHVVYLDSDMLILDDLGILWTEFVSDDNPAAAAQDYKIPLVSSEQGLKNYQDLHLPPETPYFNAGLLLMNLRQWRKEQLAQRVFEYIGRHAEIIQMADQEGLNVILADKWSRIDPRWNISTHLYEGRVTPDNPNYDYLMQNRDALLEKPGIIHFTGPGKPWNFRSTHPAEREWAHYLRQSGWFTEPEFQVWQLKHNLKKQFYAAYKKTIAPIRYRT